MKAKPVKSEFIPTQRQTAVYNNNSWKRLEEIAKSAKKRRLSSFFEAEPDRANLLKVSAAGITIDFSRTHVDSTIVGELLELAKDAELKCAISDLFSTEKINYTEKRPALHVALRGNYGSSDIQESISTCKDKIKAITNKVLNQNWTGPNSEPITDVVNIGIGGSHLGPQMVTEALSPYKNNHINSHFVSNVDPHDIYQLLPKLQPEKTLFIVSSKSWTTLETLTNAEAAKEWIRSSSLDTSNHFIGISTNTSACEEFGIHAENILPMWDWVGGRFSLWSAIGLPICLATSFEVFERLLYGANAMDTHFQQADLSSNLPLILSLLEIWYGNFWHCQSTACLPYDHNLRLLPDYLQQLAMESNGKTTDALGNTVNYSTSPVIWGAAGTNGQHSFHQLLHQGSQLIPVDFILPLKSLGNHQEQHRHLVANCLAQAQALMEGQDEHAITSTLIDQGHSEADAKQLAKHKAILGNKPSTIISMDQLTPENLGALISLYEHKIFCSGVIWNINSFDQWGVELGKIMSKSIYKALSDPSESVENQATKASIQQYMDSNASSSPKD